VKTFDVRINKHRYLYILFSIIPNMNLLNLVSFFCVDEAFLFSLTNLKNIKKGVQLIAIVFLFVNE